MISLGEIKYVSVDTDKIKVILPWKLKLYNIPLHPYMHSIRKDSKNLISIALV